MSGRAAAWLAWSLWALYVALAVPSVLLQVANAQMVGGGGGAPADFGANLLDALEGAVALLVMVTVGALVASRRPVNPIGWLYCVVPLASGSGSVGLQYAVYALQTAPGSLPAGVWVGLLGGWTRSVGFILFITFPVLLFPTGKLLSPRWRPVAWLCGVALAVYSTQTLLVPDAFANADDRLAAVRNPIGFIQNPILVGLMEGGGALLLLAATAACGVSIVVRFRRARGVERQQLKWFVFAVVCVLVIYAGILVVVFLPGSTGAPGWLFYLIFVAPPIATGIAILRYRLWDIDVLINRTLVYGTLTVALAAVYFAAVASAQLIVRALTGQRADVPPVVVVASTLLIAALFMPLRRSIQAGIDRRFYRRKYDAARTLAAFGVTLRTETNLGDLRAHLVAAVEDTMHPAYVSLWLRPADRDTATARVALKRRELEGGRR